MDQNISLNENFRNKKIIFYTLASAEFPSKKSRNPFIIQDELVSPGCTLEVITTPFNLKVYQIYNNDNEHNKSRFTFFRFIFFH
jgi:hypothetical protein